MSVEELKDLLVLLSRVGTFLVLITAIIGSVYFYKYKHTYIKYFLALLWYTIFNELLSFFVIKHKILSASHILYNIYYLIYFSILFILFRKYVKEKNHKKWILIFLYVYLSAFTINSFFQNYLIDIQNLPFIIASIFIIISILFYFLEILNTNKVLYVSKNLLFWISMGLLMYFAVRIPTRLILNNWELIAYYNEIRLIEFISAFVTYICFIIGFITSQKE